MFNSLPACRWVANQNVTFGKGATGHAYESGRPDGFVFWQGRVVCIEAKAGWGAAYLGNPNNPDDTAGWSAAQRSWWRNVAEYTGTPYYIALWVYPSRERPGRVMQKDASLFLVPPAAWLALEMEAIALGTRTVALTPALERVHSRRALNLVSAFGAYALQFSGGRWQLPEHFLKGNYVAHQPDPVDPQPQPS